MSRSRLGKSFVFKRFYEDLSDRYGDKKASAIWTYMPKKSFGDWRKLTAVIIG